MADSHERWLDGFPLIAHALGAFEGRKYTNSAESLDRAYRRGIRLFEADVALTSDGVPVLIHGWTTGDYARLGWDDPEDTASALSSDSFRSKFIHGALSTLHLSDLFAFMVHHKDVRVLLDIRPQDASSTARIYELIRELCPSQFVADRCMAGTYTVEMAETVRARGFFEALNLAYDPAAYDSVADFVSLCRRLNVQTVSVSSVARGAEIIDPLRRVGIDVLLFTENKPAAVVEALRQGIAAVGTDTVSPEQVKRARETRVRSLKPYEDDSGNRVIFGGVRAPKSVLIRFRGHSNTLFVADGARLDRLDVIFDNDGAAVTIGSSRPGIPTGSFIIRAGQDSSVSVGKDVSCTGVAFLSATEGTSVTVGNDVMFARGNEVRADDAHAIFDVATAVRVNTSASILIGDHVWLARDATLLRGSRIGSGSVVGYRSIVTGTIPNNCIAVGAPARVVRRDIAWERPHLDDYPPYKPDASVIETSAYWAMTERESL